MDSEECVGTIRAFAVNAHDPDEQHDVLFLGVGGIFAVSTLKVEKTAHSCLITDGDTGVIASWPTLDQFQLFFAVQGDGMVTSKFLQYVIEHDVGYDELSELRYYVQLKREKGALDITVYDIRVVPRLTQCATEAGWCDINPAKEVDSPDDGSWQIMNRTFQAIASGEFSELDRVLSNALFTALTPGTDVKRPLYRYGGFVLRLDSEAVCSDNLVQPLDPVTPPEQQVGATPALVDTHHLAPGPLPHTGKSRKRSASTGDQGSGPLKRPTGYLSGFNLFAKEKRKDFQELYPGTEKNEMNKIVGRAWKCLPQSVRAVYEERAKADKLRYLREVREYNEAALAASSGATTASASSGSVSSAAASSQPAAEPYVPRINHPLDTETLPPGIRRPKSAYNHFGRLEGQALRLIPELKSKMSSCFSSRWRDIEHEQIVDDAGVAERDLYVQLEQADLRECQRQLRLYNMLRGGGGGAANTVDASDEPPAARQKADV